MEKPNRIREWMDLRQLNQTQLARRVRSSQPTIEKLENGKMQLTEKWLRKLAAALHCAPADLLTGGSDVAIDLVERDLVRWYREAHAKNQQALMDLLKSLAILPGGADPPRAPSPAAGPLPRSRARDAPLSRPTRARTLHEPPPHATPRGGEGR